MPKKSKKQIEDEIRIEEENKNFTAHVNDYLVDVYLTASEFLINEFEGNVPLFKITSIERVYHNVFKFVIKFSDCDWELQFYKDMPRSEYENNMQVLFCEIEGYRHQKKEKEYQQKLYNTVYNKVNNFKNSLSEEEKKVLVTINEN